MSETMSRPLRIGAKVRLYGTLGELHTVKSYRIGRHGIFYTFRSEHGYTTEGYDAMVKEIVSR